MMSFGRVMVKMSRAPTVRDFVMGHFVIADSVAGVCTMYNVHAPSFHSHSHSYYFCYYYYYIMIEPTIQLHFITHKFNYK